jgi:hypothetical protein
MERDREKRERGIQKKNTSTKKRERIFQFHIFTFPIKKQTNKTKSNQNARVQLFSINCVSNGERDGGGGGG